MSTEAEAENEAIVRRWVEEVWNQRRMEVVDELMAAGHVSHALGPDGSDLQGPEAFKQVHQAFTAAIPDLSLTIDRAIVSGEWVAIHVTCQGTHTGEGLGFAATGRSATFPCMSMLRIRDGKILEGYNVLNLQPLLPLTDGTDQPKT